MQHAFCTTWQPASSKLSLKGTLKGYAYEQQPEKNSWRVHICYTKDSLAVVLAVTIRIGSCLSVMNTLWPMHRKSDLLFLALGWLK